MKLIIKISCLLYAFLLFYIFFLARRRPHATLFMHKAGVNLIPLKMKWESFIDYNSLSSFYKWSLITDFFGNILFFIPIPFFLRFVFNIRNNWKILLIAIVVSIGVELTQFILSIGIADIDDLILNTIGAAIGIGFLRIINKKFSYLYAILEEQSKVEEPTFGADDR